MKKINFKNIIWKEGKHYVAQCLNIDVSSFGRTKNETIANLDEALELYFEDVNKPNINKIKAPEIISLRFQHA